MRVIVVLMSTLFLLIGCQQRIDNEYSHVSIKDEAGDVLVTASDFEKASVQQQEEQVVITADFKQGKTSKEMTKDHLHEKIHVYLGDTEIASPVIHTVINSGSIQIAGDFSKEDAEKFVDVIHH
ncbi:hypothetical protein MUN89_05960 [Halobacillus salinarum]|uniref:SecDF P1 head subdomain domain-containing protein n=1 Tax=Halobacillus salinarum TaxID=2932257 RepID=A0ABY4EM14_9BACI|nr:hypothetical protein [Halobacillus salinarum]UOQ45489.1 hypothetical protein MUN89_05960 [Halobacillus salinarum]